MFVRKDKAGGIGPYQWEKDGDVVEVDDAFGLQLLSIGHAGFAEVAPAASVSEVEPVAEEPAVEVAVESEDSADSPARRTRRQVVKE